MSDSGDNGEPLLSPSNKQHDKQERSIPNGGGLGREEVNEGGATATPQT